MSDSSIKVECHHHGSRDATFVCQHLARGQARGFFTAEADGDPRPDAWCFGCEQVANAHGGWDDESEAIASITLLCAGCYDEVRLRNSRPRPSLDRDGWCLGTRADVHAMTPDFVFPSTEAIRQIAKGTFVKALFYVVGSSDSSEYVQGEKMWIQVTRRYAGRFVGKLASEPTTHGRLVEGAVVRIPEQLVIEIYQDDD